MHKIFNIGECVHGIKLNSFNQGAIVNYTIHFWTSKGKKSIPLAMALFPNSNE